MHRENTEKVAEYKIILLHILNSFGTPVTESQLTHFILEKDIMNYFIFKQHLSELVHSQMTELHSAEKMSYYLLTSKGKRTLEMFKKLITEELREFLDKEIKTKKKQYNRDNEIITNYIKIGEYEYITYLMVIEKGSPLMDLRIIVGSAEQAEKICKNWRDNAVDAFKQILDIVT